MDRLTHKALCHNLERTWPAANYTIDGDVSRLPNVPEPAGLKISGHQPIELKKEASLTSCWLPVVWRQRQQQQQQLEACLCSGCK